ncbi:hypothetical protein [Microbacterium sp. RURRCA19A]|uniref:hypothetical protein n=1 Tax=Microbacterium sp. RURRCA19A TaxID=1907391 RepID=UPI000955A938|nr:hypothetical protein [Microbacterium sp. RURRCA19A]SIS01021.1 hypothetical protein SAMN05880568_2367 [Microbacterium sp. RURRCA19A]
MGVSLLSIGIPVVAAVLLVALPYLGGPSTWQLFVRFVAGFAFSAIAATALYVTAQLSGRAYLISMGDAAMALGPSLLFVALCAWTGRRVIEASVLAFALTLLVTIVSAVVPQPVPLAVKSAAVVVVCGACAWAATRSGAEPARPLRLIALVNAVYAVYTLTRMLVGVAAGWDTATVLAGVFFIPAMVSGVAAVVLVWVAVACLWREYDRAQASRRRAGASLVVVGDWRLASAAYGPNRVYTLVAELRAAARDLDPAASDAPRGVEVMVPGAVAALSERVRSAYGWNPDEVALLSEGMSTGAIPLRPARGRSRGRSARF